MADIRVGIDGSGAKKGRDDVVRSLGDIKAEAAKMAQGVASASQAVLDKMKAMGGGAVDAIRRMGQEQRAEVARARALIIIEAQKQVQELVSIAKRERDAVMAEYRGKSSDEAKEARRAASERVAEARRAGQEYIATIRAETAAAVAEARRRGDLLVAEAANQAKREQQARQIQLRSAVMTGNQTSRQNARFNSDFEAGLAENARRDAAVSRGESGQAAALSGLRSSAIAVSSSPAAAKAAADMDKLAQAYRAGAISQKEFAAGQAIVRQRLAESSKAATEHTRSLRELALGGSSLQRVFLNTSVALRGMAAAFGFREILDANLKLQQFENTLKAASGSQSAYIENLNFLRKTADDVGVNVGSVGNSFSRFTLAAKAAGFSTSEVHKAFEQLTGASRNFGLSADDTTGVIRALEQSLSKGKFMAEEVRLQLGDRLPIAMQALQKATGASSAELNKMFEQGSISTEKFFVPFVKQLFELSGGQKALAISSQSLSADLGRLGTAFLFAAGEGGAAGFNAAVGDAAKALAGFLEGASGQGAFRAMGTAIKFLTDNFKLLAIAAGAFISLKFASVIGQVAQQALIGARNMAVYSIATREFSVAMTAAAVAGRGFSTALSFFGGLPGIAITAALVGITAAIGAFSSETDIAEQAAGDYERAMKLAGDALGYIPQKANKANDAVQEVTKSLVDGAAAAGRVSLDSSGKAIASEAEKIGKEAAAAIAKGMTFAGEGDVVREDNQAQKMFDSLLRSVRDNAPKTSSEIDLVIGQLNAVYDVAKGLGDQKVMSGVNDFTKSLQDHQQKMKDFESNMKDATAVTEAAAEAQRKLADAIDMRLAIQEKADKRLDRLSGPSPVGRAQDAINAQMAPEQADAKAFSDALSSKGIAAAKEVEAQQKRTAEATRIASKAFKDYQESIGIQTSKQVDLKDALTGTDLAMKAAAEQAQKNAKNAVELNAATEKAIKIEELAVKIRDESRGGLDTLAKKIKEVYEAYGAGRITQDEFNGALNAIRADGMDAYKKAIKDGQTELAKLIKTQLLADAAAQDAANNMAKSAVSVINSVQTALSGVIAAGQQAGGVLATVANAAQGALDWAKGFFTGKEKPETTPGMDSFNEQWKKYLQSLKDPAAETKAKFSDQIKDLKNTLDAQLKVNAAYQDGALAVAKARAEIEIQTKLNELSLKYTKAQVAEAEKLIRANDAAKRAEESLKEIQSLKDGNELLQKQLDLIGATTVQRERELAVLKATQDLRNRGEDPTSENGKRVIAETLRGVDLQIEINKQQSIADEISGFFESAFDKVGSSITDAFTKGEGAAIDFASVVDGVTSEIIQEFVKLSVINPLKNMLFNRDDPTISDVWNRLTGGTANDNKIPDVAGDVAAQNIGSATISIGTATISGPIGAAPPVSSGGIPDRPGVLPNSADEIRGALGAGAPIGGAASDTLSDSGVQIANTAKTFSGGFMTTLMGLADGMKNSSNMFISGFGQVFSFILQAIQGIGNSIGGGSGGGGILGSIGSWVGSLFGGGVSSPGIGAPGTGGSMAAAYHTGGIVGSAPDARVVSLDAYRNAVRYHSGGMAGFAPDEVPAILRRNEEVLTREDPRHRWNQGSNYDGRPTTVTNNYKIIDRTSEGVEVREESRQQNGTGGDDITILLDTVVAKKLGKRGSKSNKVLRGDYGAQQRLRGR